MDRILKGITVLSTFILASLLLGLHALPARANQPFTKISKLDSLKYNNTFAKDFIMDAPWRVIDASTTIPVTIILKDCDVDDIAELHWIRCWDVTGGGSTILWDHDFGDETIGDDASEDNY